MTFKILKQMVDAIISTIQNTGIASVRAMTKTITQHTYPVEVQNPVREVRVEGTVKVSNPSNYAKQLKSVEDAVKELKKYFVKEVKVSNFPKYPDFPKFPEFPKEFKVTNLRDKTEVTNLNVVVNALGELEKKISKLKLDPTIKVDAPTIPAPVVHVEKTPSPTVNVEAPDLSLIQSLIDYFENLNVKKPLPVRLSDGQTFYKALDKITEFITSNKAESFIGPTGVPDKARIDKNQNLKVTTNDTWGVNHIEKIDDTEYLGKQNVDGNYLIMKIVTDGDLQTLTYASQRNNDEETYSDAWSARGDLNYGLIEESF